MPCSLAARRLLRLGGKAKADKDIVSPHSIDAFWMQRMVGEVYPDPQTASDKTASVLSILGSESKLRGCENQLMELFDYQAFDVITKFLKNCDVVVRCTKLACSDVNEHVNVEVAMRKKGLGWILRELAGDRQAKAHAEDAMDVDEQAKSAQADLSPVQALVIPHGHGSVCSLVKPAKVVASTTPTLSVVAPQKRNTTHGQFAYATRAGCGEPPVMHSASPATLSTLPTTLTNGSAQQRCDRRWSGPPRRPLDLISRSR